MDLRLIRLLQNFFLAASISLHMTGGSSSFSVKDYCERRYFRAVHIFTKFAFLKYPRNYVHIENYFYISLKSQLYIKREF